MADGILCDLQSDSDPELSGTLKSQWIVDHLDSLLFGSNAVAECASASFPWVDAPGIYFLIWNDRVCYVGQSFVVSERIEAHLREGRPIEKVAAIVGIPPWALDEIEHAYISAWSPPWNDETKRSGSLRDIPRLLNDACALDRSNVMKPFAAKVSPGSPRLKAWQLNVIGYMQHLGSN